MISAYRLRVMPDEPPSFLLVMGYTLQIPVCVMAIVFLFDLAGKYGCFHPAAVALMGAFAAITIHAGYRLWRLLFAPALAKKRRDYFPAIVVK